MSNSNANSEDSTANSGPKDLFQCCHCQRAFTSGQALGGHQNAHRDHNRVVRKLIDVTEAHSSNTFATAARSEFQVADSADELLLEMNVERGDYHGIVHTTAGLVAASSGDGYFHELTDDPCGMMIRSEDYDQPKEAREGIFNVTKDFLGKLNYHITNNVGVAAAAEPERSSERTLD